MNKLFILFCLFAFSGCATLPISNRPIVKNSIRYSGMAGKVSSNFFTNEKKVMENKKSFSLNEPQAIWWAQFWESNAFPLKLHAKWFDASGNLYKEYDFFEIGNINRIISTALPIRNCISADQQGQWKVIIYFRTNEIDSQEFYIGKMSEEIDSEISEEKLKEIFTNLDKANALILLNEVDVEVDKNYKTKTIIKRRTKILSDRGKQLHSVVNIPFYSTFESVKVNMAHTIRPDGEIIEAKEMQMFSPFEVYPNYKASKILGIAMPSIEKGCIIEYEIEIESWATQTLPNFWDSFYFSAVDPVLLSKYVVVCPEYFELNISEFNIEIKPEIVTDEFKHTKTYVWQKNNWQAVESEKYSPSPRETLPNINLYTNSSWKDVAVWWNKLSKSKMQANSEILNKAKELTDMYSNELEKVKAIFYFIQSEIRYVEVSFGASPYQPISAVETFKNKYGDCKDQTTLLITMLNSIGIYDAHYGIVRTKGGGPVNKMAASPREFDHVIAMVKLGDKEIFLDPTAKKLEFSIPPFSIQGTEVFVISGESGYFTQIPLWDADSNQIASFITLNINNDLEIDGKLGVIYKGQEEWFMRMYLEKIEPKQREEFVHSVLTNVYPGAIVKNYTVKHEDDLDEDLEIEINFSLSNWLEKAGKVYLLKFIDDKMTSPPEYLSLERKFPIKKAYKGMTKSRIEINLPAKFFIEDLPQDFTIESDYLSSSIRYKKFNNKIVREQVIKFLILDIPVNDVIKYKDLYEKIFKAHKQAIVLAESN